MELKHWPRASHFIGSESCSFGMTTVVNGYIVSSVGDYRSAAYGGERQTLGAGDDDFYETYIFKPGGYCEIEGCHCGGIPRPVTWTEIDGKRFATESECRDGHAAFVEKYAKEPTP